MPEPKDANCFAADLALLRQIMTSRGVSKEKIDTILTKHDDLNAICHAVLSELVVPQRK